jgi:DNA-binding LacI/PurR family transcriptional regulator
VAVGQPIELTSIDIPANAVGTLAVEMVMGLLDGTGEAETRLLSPKLTERASCAPPRAVRHVG